MQAAEVEQERKAALRFSGARREGRPGRRHAPGALAAPLHPTPAKRHSVARPPQPPLPSLHPPLPGRAPAAQTRWTVPAGCAPAPARGRGGAGTSPGRRGGAAAAWVGAARITSAQPARAYAARFAVQRTHPPSARVPRCRSTPAKQSSSHPASQPPTCRLRSVTLPYSCFAASSAASSAATSFCRAATLRALAASPPTLQVPKGGCTSVCGGQRAVGVGAEASAAGGAALSSNRARKAAGTTGCALPAPHTNPTPPAPAQPTCAPLPPRAAPPRAAACPSPPLCSEPSAAPPRAPAVPPPPPAAGTMHGRGSAWSRPSKVRAWQAKRRRIALPRACPRHPPLGTLVHHAPETWPAHHAAAPEPPSIERLPHAPAGCAAPPPARRAARPPPPLPRPPRARCISRTWRLGRGIKNGRRGGGKYRQQGGGWPGALHGALATAHAAAVQRLLHVVFLPPRPPGVLTRGPNNTPRRRAPPTPTFLLFKLAKLDQAQP